jgi:P27 family predicted phage terminase small subunit
MGLRGAAPTPTALKELRGNPGRRPLPENEPTTDPLSITPSSAIENDEVAKEFWYAVGNMTKAMNVAQESDRMALEILAMSLAEVRRAYIQLEERGRTVVYSNGVEQVSPYFSIMHKMMSQAMSIMKEFGMTPASRTRVKAMAQPTKKSAFAKFMEGSEE